MNNFLPANLEVSFDMISGDDVIRKVISKIPDFLRSIFTDNSAAAFRLHNRPETTQSWSWAANGLGETARSDFLYTTHRPITNYSLEEVGSPFLHERSLWYTCAGLISQVMMTMPMAGLETPEEEVWTISSVPNLINLQFDPTRISSDPGLSYTEEYVERLLADSFAESSTFWHYAARHAPSISLACEPPAAAAAAAAKPRYMVFSNNLGTSYQGMVDDLPPIPMHGYAAFSLGEAGKRSGCFCAWEMLPQGRCNPPDDVCLHLTENATASCSYDLEEDQANVIRSLLEHWKAGNNQSSQPIIF